MMTPVDCAREREIVRVVLSRGPAGLTDEQSSHVQACNVCRDVASLVAAFREERDELLGHARVPAAGQVWWRSALRAHAEAAGAARRPMIWVQGIAGACAAGLVAALVSVAWPSIYDTAAAVAAISLTLRPDVTPLLEAVRPALPLAVAVVACVVLTPVVVYLALSDD